MLSREDFTTAYANLYATLEKRRKRYLTIFYVNLCIAALLLITVVCFPHAALSALAGLLKHPHAASGGEVASFVFFGCFTAFMLICTPVLRYNGGLKAEYSLNRMVMLSIGELIGDCSIASPASSFAHLARESGFFPSHAGIAERVGLKGETNGISYSIEEMAVSAQPEEGQGCAFRGLVIVCNNSKRRSGLVSSERKRTLIAPEAAIVQEALISAGWEKFSIFTPERAVALALSAVSTDAEAMKSTVTGEWLASLQTLSAGAAALPIRELRLDSRLINKAQAALFSWREWRAGKSERSALTAEIEYDEQFAKSPDMRQARQLRNSPLQGKFAAAVLGENCVILIPTDASIFVSGSLFEPSFSKADAGFLYGIITWINDCNLPLPK